MTLYLEDLKRLALENICNCYYYDLVDALDDAGGDDTEFLLNIIKDPKYCHKQAKNMQPVFNDDELIKDCCNI